MKAVHCKTREEWDFVLSKFNPAGLQSSNFDYYNSESCINIITGKYASMSFYRENDYNIISFDGWCKNNDYTFKSSQDGSDCFTLPELWSIRVTDESEKEVGKWRKMGSLLSGSKGWCLSDYNGARGYYVDCFNKQYPEITYEQFCKYVIKKDIKSTPLTKSDSFSLPKMWCIIDYPEVVSFFEAYNHGGYLGGSDSYLHYPKVGTKCYFKDIQSGYTQITLEQFKKYVIGDTKSPEKKIDARYKGFIRGNGTLEFGKRIIQHLIDNGADGTTTYDGSSHRGCYYINDAGKIYGTLNTPKSSDGFFEVKLDAKADAAAEKDIANFAGFENPFLPKPKESTIVDKSKYFPAIKEL